MAQEGLCAGRLTHGAGSAKGARGKNEPQAMEKAERATGSIRPAAEGGGLFRSGNGMLKRGSSALALELLRRAQEACPADFGQPDLGMAAERNARPRRREAIRFLRSMDVALRDKAPLEEITNLGTRAGRRRADGRGDSIAYRQRRRS